MSWEGYGADGDTYEPPEHLPKASVKAFERWASQLPRSTWLVLSMLRDLKKKNARRLLERRGAAFGLEVDVPAAALPEYADAIFKILGASRRGPALTVETEKNATHVLRTLMVTSQEHAAWLVGLQDARPEHGTGALRIKAGGRANKDMVMVVATPQTPIVLEHRAPKETAGEPQQGSYSFKVSFSTVAFNGITGAMQPYTAPAEELQLTTADEAALVAHAKRALLQTYAARPVAHPLRSTWAALPAGQLVLPQP